MKKIIFIITFTICLSLYVIPVYAGTYANNYGYTINKVDDSHYQYNLYYYNLEYYVDASQNYFRWCSTMSQGMANNYQDAISALNSTYNEYQPVNGIWLSGGGGPVLQYQNSSVCYVYNMPLETIPQDIQIININSPFDPREPAAPFEPSEPINNWFRDLWDSIMDSLAITDDFSNDLYNWIFEGEDGGGGHSAGHSFEYITPTPNPTPLPLPTPTPYSLEIVDNNGNLVYTITGIPNQTITVNNTTNNENGDNFDIFEVDVKLLPSGGVSNPKDGLNSVMESNLEVLDNIDVTAVGASFSVIPSDWFIMLGAIICMPFIAGFISKLLK